MKNMLSKKTLAAIKQYAKSTTLQTLLGAYYLLSSRKRWAQHWEAMTTSGRRCDPLDHDAHQFCLMGALMRSRVELGIPQPIRIAWDAARIIESQPFFERLTRNWPAESFASVQGFNDCSETTFADVKRCLAKTIKRQSRGRIILREVRS